MHFCLAPLDLRTPGKQTWRYISPDDITTCTTEVVTLIATSTEHWRLHLNDNNIFEDAVTHASGYGKGYASASAEDQARIVDMGDDLATEGEATSWDLYTHGGQMN
jgi:hypothetical protein